MEEKIKSAAFLYKKSLIEEQLKSDVGAQVTFLQSSFDESQNSGQLLSAIRSVADARGFSGFANKANLNRENLYRVLCADGNPRLDTFLKILDALDFKLTVKIK